jgi:hypothetical protein
MYDSIIEEFVDHTIIRIEDNMHITADEANYEYQAYLAWVTEGNTPAKIDLSQFKD